MTVKTFKYLILGILALAASFSCSGSSKEDPWPDALYCSATSVQLFSDSESCSLEFTSPARWTATCSAEWIALGVKSGDGAREAQTLDMALQKNGGLEERSALVHIETDSESLDVLLYQSNLTEQEFIAKYPQDAPASVSLNLENGDVSCDYSRLESDILFSSNAMWTLSSDMGWVGFSQTAGFGNGARKVVLYVMENPQRVERRAEVVLKAGDETRTFSIVQKPAPDGSISGYFDRVVKAGYAYQYICAHRANTYSGIYDRRCPENTSLAVEECIRQGMDMVEIDGRMTKDNVIVCMHDDYIDNVTTKSGRVSDYTYEELQAIPMKVRETGAVVENAHIESLESVLRTCDGRIWVNLDFSKDRSEAFIRAAIKVIAAAGMLDQCTVYIGTVVDAAKLYYELSGGMLSVDFYVGSTPNVSGISYFMTKPVLQYSNSDWKNGAATSSRIRDLGYCSFSNMINDDAAVRKGNTALLDAWTASRTDFMQTDSGDHEAFMSYLRSRGLR